MDTQHFKKKLEAELMVVEGELKEIAALNPESGEWEAKVEDMGTVGPIADSNEFADQLEEYDEHREELPALAARWSEVKHALEKIDRGTYGFCEEGGDHAIEPERLDANPAARTCQKHM